MAATTDHEDETERSSSVPASPRGRRRPPRHRGRIAATVSVFGELLITAGLVLGLFVAYSLWWTNVIADREAHKQADKVRDHWAQSKGTGTGKDKDTGPGALDTKDGIGFLHVPSMKNGEVLVQKGTARSILNEGVAGYYTKPSKATLPMSGKDGNFTLAAHRDGHGAKFHNIDKIKVGDPIVFESKDNWYIYKVYDILPQTSKYNTKVILPVPKESGVKKPGHYITLTTCTPVYTSRYRYVVWGELERVQKVDADRTPPKELR
ncbi:class E sortase [Streptomyces beihaiensis]|uniref:Class E sortase n=1 Tax=Streptomyces beihaiensis TaxID=2984495 RepID=A0ABT3U6H4_9ACTN|nr:class E sortase [Streptomyces beihaiensis]MCX3063793.1 class E sortase [Streptomyces beihaiensis]